MPAGDWSGAWHPVECQALVVSAGDRSEYLAPGRANRPRSGRRRFRCWADVHVGATVQGVDPVAAVEPILSVLPVGESLSRRRSLPLSVLDPTYSDIDGDPSRQPRVGRDSREELHEL